MVAWALVVVRGVDRFFGLLERGEVWDLRGEGSEDNEEGWYLKRGSCEMVIDLRRPCRSGYCLVLYSNI